MMISFVKIKDIGNIDFNILIKKEKIVVCRIKKAPSNRGLRLHSAGW